MNQLLKYTKAIKRRVVKKLRGDPANRPLDEIVFQANWEEMSAADQKEFYNQNGFLVVPSAISKNALSQMFQEIESHGLKGTTENFWVAPSIVSLIDNRKLLLALRGILSENILFFKGAYVATPPQGGPKGKPHRRSLHVDYGIGESVGDFRNSCASWINVGFYLTDLTPDHAPFWVVPGSNHHYNIIPGSDMEALAPKAKLVLAKAGDAVLFHCLTVHGASDNNSDHTRHALFFSYRPTWAKPIGPVEEWPKELVNSAPASRQQLLRNLNQGCQS